MSASRPEVLFVCVHNAGRSQAAAAWLRHLGQGRIRVRSAGSAPGTEINPMIREAMREAGVPLRGARPKLLTEAAVRASDLVITMGCGDACPVYPGKHYLDWEVEDPAGQGIEAARRVRDDIRGRVEALLGDLGIAPSA